MTNTGRLEHAPLLEDLRKLLQDELSRSKSYEQNEIETARIIAEHWQHTNDRMTEYWKERNRLFIYALIVITIALLLSTTVEGINIIVFYVTSYLDKLTGAENSASASSLISTALIRSIIPVPVFYLVLNIFQRDLYLRRNYLYLQSLERVIRDRLALHDSEAFTRESAFYRDKETFAQRKVLSFYHIILFAIVTLFFAYRLAIDFELARNDLALGNVIVLFVDIGMAGSTIFF